MYTFDIADAPNISVKMKPLKKLRYDQLQFSGLNCRYLLVSTAFETLKKR
jgi:hypothetical protein